MKFKIILITLIIYFDGTISLSNNAKADNIKNDIIFLKTIYFDFDSYELTYKSKQNLDLLIQYLLKNKDKSITLSGYCDNIGEKNYNYNLGLKRAKETMNYLNKYGIEKSRIKIISYGKKFERKVIININKN